MVTTLTSKASNICTDEKDKKGELSFVQTALKMNVYPNSHHQKNFTSKEKENQDIKRTATILYYLEHSYYVGQTK